MIPALAQAARNSSIAADAPTDWSNSLGNGDSLEGWIAKKNRTPAVNCQAFGFLIE